MKTIVDRLVEQYGQREFVLQKRGAIPTESWKEEPSIVADEEIKAVFVPMRKTEAMQYYTDAIDDVSEIYTTSKNVEVGDTIVDALGIECVVLETTENYRKNVYLYTKVILGRHNG